MGSRRKALLELSHYANSLLRPTKRSTFPNSTLSTKPFLTSRFYSSAFPKTSTSTSTDGAVMEHDQPPQSNRDAMLLEKFRLRKLQGSSKISQESSSSNGGEKVMTDFSELGLCNEVAEAVQEMGIFAPSELHCVGIPPILEGKNVVLGSLYGPERALAYLLPLIQNLKRDGKKYGTRSKHPRAFVLCSSVELSDEVFQMAKLVSNYRQLKTARDNGCGELELQKSASDSDVSIGLLIGTPGEIFKLIEEGSVVPDEIKYLVLDEFDLMFDLGFGPNIKEILTSVRHCNEKCQSVVVTSTLIKMLHEQHSSLVESLKHGDAGEISAMLLEIEEDEAFHLMESPDTLKCKLADVVESLRASTQRA